MERVVDVTEQQQPLSEGGEGPARTSATVDRLRVATEALGHDESRFAAAKRINTLLGSLSTVSSLEERPVLARAVLGWLDDPAFKAAFDVDGGSCRVNAVGMLLAFGYPWALELHPDDLAFYRQKTKGVSARARWVVVGLVALLMAGFGMALAGSQTQRPRPPAPIVAPRHVEVVPTVVDFDAPPVPVAPAVPAASARFVRAPSSVQVRTAGPHGVERLTEVKLQYTELPEAEAALEALEREDFNGVFSQVNRCVARYEHSEACRVLKIIALRMHGGAVDSARAESELIRLRAHDSKNVSLPGLEAL